MATKYRLRSLDPRCVLVLLALISITCFAVALGIYDHSGTGYADYWADWGDGLAMASVFPSVFWTLSVLIYKHHGVRIRPAWHVGVELISFLAIASCCGMGVALSQIFTIATVLAIGGDEDCASWPQQMHCNPHIRGTLGIAIAAYAGAFVVAIIHFVYFVIACRTTELRNRESRRRNKLKRQDGLEAAIIANEDEEKRASLELCPTYELGSPDNGRFNYDHTFAAEVPSEAIPECVAKMSSPVYPEHVAELDTAKRQASPEDLRGLEGCQALHTISA